MQQQEHNECNVSILNKKTCGLSKTGPYKLEFCAPPGVYELLTGILNIFLFSKLQKIRTTKMKPERTLNQTVVSRIKTLNSPTALIFSVFHNTVRNVVLFIKLRYLYIA